MLESISLKSKLLIPVFGLIIILLFLGSIIIISNYKQIESLNKLDEKITLSNVISQTLHSIQKERGLSSGYLSNEITFKDELLIQRKTTDGCIEKLKIYVDSISDEELKQSFKIIFEKAKNIKSIRSKINNFKIGSSELIVKYTEINSKLLELIIDISKTSHVPSITQNILTYINFLYLKEYAGLERAQGVLILSSDDMNIKQFIQFTNLMILQKEKESMFIKYASLDIQNYYNRIIGNKSFKELKDIETLMVMDFVKDDIDPKFWYDKSTKKLDAFERISKYIKLDTDKKISKEIQNSKKIFTLVVLLTFLSLIVFILMIIAFVKMAKEEQRLRLVMNKYIISSVTNLKGTIIDVSEPFCEISGYKKNELIGKNHNILRHPDMPKETFKELWTTIHSGKSWSGKVKNRKKDGGFYWVYANIEPLYDKHGNIDSYISIRLDVTQSELLLLKIQKEELKSKQQNEILQQQYRLAQMGEMLSMIAHQWRQPLSAITAATGVISLRSMKNKLNAEDAIKLADKIKGYSLYLSHTIDDFRNFFKPNKEKNLTNYSKIINSVLLIVEGSLEKNNIELNIELINVEEFQSYENELKQVLLNLIKNAEDILLENKIENPKIIIKVDKNILTITDNAGGVPDDIIDKIFNPYFSTKLKKDGTGLGLYMSRTIVEEHCKGSLSVTNTNDGATFKINLEKIND